MLRESVKEQHNKWETKARVRVANVWRQAHEGAGPKPATPPRPGSAPRPGGAMRASGANYSTPRELYGGQDWNRTVDVMHGEAEFVVLIFIERQGTSSIGHTNIDLVASYGGHIELCWLTTRHQLGCVADIYSL